MYQSALRLRSSCQPKLPLHICHLHARPLSTTAGSVPVANTHQHAKEALEPWQDSRCTELASSYKGAKDVDVDDLSATLEAHRASNRADVILLAVIRKTYVSAIDSPGPKKWPLLEQDNGGCNGSEEMKEEKRFEPFRRPLGNNGTKSFAEKSVKDEKHAVVEHTGVEVETSNPWRIGLSWESTPLQRPWMAYMKPTGEDNFEHLTNEIRAYEAYMRLSPREEAASELVISDVNSVAQNEPEIIKPLSLIGSRSTGLATPISDFDFSFTMSNFAPPSSLPGRNDSKTVIKFKAAQALRKVKRHFLSSSKFCNTELLLFARVPIIRSTHVATGLNVQIQTMTPYRTSHEYTMAFLSEFPSLRPLYIILRYCLELRNLTTVFEGGLGSYSTFMMIVTALKHSSGKFASDDLGGQLLHVLEFYGNADLYRVGFSVNPPRTFEKKMETVGERMADGLKLSGLIPMQTFYPRRPYLLCLQDPANDSNDLGKNSYAIKHIQSTFSIMKQRIQTSLEDDNNTLDGKTRASMRSYLGLLCANYTDFELHRSRVELYADRTNLDDQDYSEARILRDYRKRGNQYNPVAGKDDNLVPSTEAIDGEVAETIGRENSVDDGWGLRARKRSAEDITRGLVSMSSGTVRITRNYHGIFSMQRLFSKEPLVRRTKS